MISENALEILNKRYFLKDKNGKVIEDWDKLCRRVAKVVSQDEPKEHQKKWEDKYYDLMYNLKFLPNSPTLMNAGANTEGLSACYVIPIEDSMENIMNAVKYSALVHKSGGGTGFSFSKLRPVNSVVKSTSGVASGPVSFMRMINAVTEEIKQGGKRRGANLGSISCSHPDIEEFIDCKKDTSKITNFNISVEITDVFMNAVENNTEYDIIDPRTKQIVKKIKARSIFDKIVHNAWETGEPGLLFIDTINKKNLYGTIETTNPCITGDTYILTIDGPISIKELESVMNNSKNMLNKIDIYCWDKINNLPVMGHMSNFQKTGENVSIIKIIFDSGIEIKVTPEHNFFGRNNRKIKAKNLHVGSRVRNFVKYKTRISNGISIGLSKIVSIEKCENEDVYNGTVDKYHNYIIVDKYFNKKESFNVGIISANCGEVPLLPYESCNLGSINLSQYVGEVLIGSFDFDLLREDIPVITRFLDSIISINHYPIEEIEIATKFTRKIGIGIMGLADAFIKMGIPYGNPRSFDEAEDVMQFINEQSKKASIELANEKGECLASQKLRKDKKTKIQVRNFQTTAIAPTGTISLIAGASSGCEPLFAVGYIRKVVGSKDMKFIHPLFEESLKKENIVLTKELEDKIFSYNSIANITEIPDKIRNLFKTALDITYVQHIEMQAALQKYVDAGISKTINLSNLTTKEIIKEAYFLAYKLGCKGITVYRDGCRPAQILSTKQEEKPRYKQRTKITHGITEKLATPLGKLYLTINKNKEEDNELVEIFIQIGKTGSDIKAYNEAVGRLISLCFKYRIPPKDIVKQLKGIKGEDAIFCDGTKYGSIIDLVGRKLENYIIEKTVEKYKCPECGNVVYMEESCIKCPCGYSKC